MAHQPPSPSSTPEKMQSQFSFSIRNLYLPHTRAASSSNQPPDTPLIAQHTLHDSSHHTRAVPAISGCHPPFSSARDNDDNTHYRDCSTPARARDALPFCIAPPPSPAVQESPFDWDHS